MHLSSGIKFYVFLKWQTEWQLVKQATKNSNDKTYKNMVIFACGHKTRNLIHIGETTFNAYTLVQCIHTFSIFIYAETEIHRDRRGQVATASN